MVQDIFFLGAAADVVNDERRAVFRAAVGDDANVQQVAGQAPGDDILLTQGADDDVGTDAGLHGNITQWIVQLTVSTVVTDSYANLRTGVAHQLVAVKSQRQMRQKREEQ